MTTWFEPQLTATSATLDPTAGINASVSPLATDGYNLVPGTYSRFNVLEAVCFPSLGSKVQYVVEVYNELGQKKASIHGSGTQNIPGSMTAVFIAGVGSSNRYVTGDDTEATASTAAEYDVFDSPYTGGNALATPHKIVMVGANCGPGSKIVIKASGKSSGIQPQVSGPYTTNLGIYQVVCSGAGHLEVEIPFNAKEVTAANVTAQGTYV